MQQMAPAWTERVRVGFVNTHQAAWTAYDAAFRRHSTIGADSEALNSSALRGPCREERGSRVLAQQSDLGARQGFPGNRRACLWMGLWGSHHDWKLMGMGTKQCKFPHPSLFVVVLFICKDAVEKKQMVDFKWLSLGVHNGRKPRCAGSTGQTSEPGGRDLGNRICFYTRVRTGTKWE